MVDATGRAAILESIRRSLAKAAAAEEIQAEYAALPRNYLSSATMGHGELLDLLEDRLVEYDAGVHRCTADQIPGTIQRILEQRGKQVIAVPGGTPPEWEPAGFQFVDATESTADYLDKKVDGLLSGCTVAIAETGTIVLQNAPAQGARLLSLVPDYHLCVIFAAQVVQTVPEALAKLDSTSMLPTTFISGPSATADIEMTRIKGVHGPRFLDTVLVI